MNTIYNLEEKTFLFAKRVRIMIKTISQDSIANNDIVQLIKFSGSIGANYLEANEKLTKKDFVYRLKISRKEAKECIFWLRLIKETSPEIDQNHMDPLIK